MYSEYWYSWKVSAKLAFNFLNKSKLNRSLKSGWSTYVLYKVTSLSSSHLPHFYIDITSFDSLVKTMRKIFFKTEQLLNISFLETAKRIISLLFQKRFYKRETIPCIRISPYSLSILSWLVYLHELRKGLIIWVEYKGSLRNTFTVFYNSTLQFFLYYKISFSFPFSIWLIPSQSFVSPSLLSQAETLQCIEFMNGIASTAFNSKGIWLIIL